MNKTAAAVCGQAVLVEESGDRDNPAFFAPDSASATHRQAGSRRPPRAAPAALAEPIEVAKFWRNRNGEAVIVQIREFEGRLIVDARVFADKQGHLRPTKKGLALSVRRLPEFAAALAKAERTARQLGLIDDDGGTNA